MLHIDKRVRACEPVGSLFIALLRKLVKGWRLEAQKRQERKELCLVRPAEGRSRADSKVVEEGNGIRKV